jgi:hypothetical protein
MSTRIDDLPENLPLSDLLDAVRTMRESISNASRGAEQTYLIQNYSHQLAPHVLKLGFYLIKVIELGGDLSRLPELRFPTNDETV